MDVTEKRKKQIRKLKGNVPDILREYHQFVCWQKKKQDEKITKVPINPKTGGHASVSNPATWGSFKKACNFYLNNDNIAGIGFVFTENDPLVGIDLDHCRDPQTKKIEKWARDIMDRANTYSEISPSGTGVHIWAKGKLPEGGRKKGKIEMYDCGRFFTVTGRHLKRAPEKILFRSGTLKAIHQQYFESESGPAAENGRTSTPRNSSDILKRASRDEKFNKLWKGDITGYTSKSEADMALCNKLAFYTGKNLEMMDRLFRESTLMREKWDEPHDSKKRTYGQITLEKAIMNCEKVYDANPLQTAKNLIAEFIESNGKNPSAVMQTILDSEELLTALAFLKKNDSGFYESSLFKIKTIGVTARDIQSLRTVIKEKARKAPSVHETEAPVGDGPVSIKSLFPDAPVNDQLVVPEGWEVNKEGVFDLTPNKSGQDQKVAQTPVFIQAKLVNKIDMTKSVRLTWWDDNKWVTYMVNREEIATATLLVKLSNVGLPVTSGTAYALLEYFSSFEAANKNFLPRATVTHQMGWQGKDGKLGFLWGYNHILPGVDLIEKMDVEKMSPEEWPPKTVFFKGSDSGEIQFAKDFHKKGKFKKWLEMIELIKKYPRVTFAVYAALTPAFLFILKHESNFTVDWSFPTSTGKTTTLKIAASCWGNPDEQSESTIVKNWDSTRTWIERANTVLHNLPLILDDTKKAKYPNLISQILYDQSSGQSRGRGSIHGMRGSGSWRTVILSSGESKATNATAGEGGTHARVLSIYGAPFGGTKDEDAIKKKAKLINQLITIIHENYGHAGPRFVQYLIKNREKWDIWRQNYASLKEMYEKRAGSNGVSIRQSAFLAIIHMVAIIAEEALELTLDYEKHLTIMSKRVLAESLEADRAKEALQLVMSWATKYQDSFWGRHDPDRKGYGGWFGAWENIENWKSIAFLPDELNEFLRKRNFEPKSIIRAWKDKGWLDLDKDEKSFQKKVTIDKERQRCVVILRHAFDEAEG